jgi:hypothetical protein
MKKKTKDEKLTTYSQLQISKAPMKLWGKTMNNIHPVLQQALETFQTMLELEN